MEVKLAKSYGFCFGVKRAISIAENSKNATTIGPLIHNNEEIKRLEKNFQVFTADSIEDAKDAKKVIIRTHGIPKEDIFNLNSTNMEVVDATCPFVTKPQEICEQVSSDGYDVVIFGDINHPEVKGVKSYVSTKAFVVLDVGELKKCAISSRVAVVSQTTRKIDEFKKIVSYLIDICKEVRVFNTICNATFENQDATDEISKESDVMIVIGGKNSSNTKQLHNISKQNCADSYLIESEKELKKEWFIGKNSCGVTAGASTPDWIIDKVIEKLNEISV